MNKEEKDVIEFMKFVVIITMLLIIMAGVISCNSKIKVLRKEINLMPLQEETISTSYWECYKYNYYYVFTEEEYGKGEKVNNIKCNEGLCYLEIVTKDCEN